MSIAVSAGAYTDARVDEIAGWLPERPAAPGARIGDRASAPVTFRDETIENKPRPDVTRLAFSFAQPVTNATLTIVYAPSHFPRPSAATSVDDYFRCVIVRKG